MIFSSFGGQHLVELTTILSALIFILFLSKPTNGPMIILVSYFRIEPLLNNCFMMWENFIKFKYAKNIPFLNTSKSINIWILKNLLNKVRLIKCSVPSLPQNLLHFPKVPIGHRTHFFNIENRMGGWVVFFTYYLQSPNPVGLPSTQNNET